MQFTNRTDPMVRSVNVDINWDQTLSFTFENWNYCWNLNEVFAESSGPDHWILRTEDGVLTCDSGQWDEIKTHFPNRPAFYHFLSWKVLLASIIGIMTLFHFSLPPISGYVASVVPQQFWDEIGKKTISGLNPKNDCSSKVQTEIVEELLPKIGVTRKYQVRIANMAQPNAFAMPGRNILITTGAIDDFQSPEELVGVLAHEIQHVEKGHVVKKIVQHAVGSIVWNLMISSITGFFGIDPELIYKLAIRRYDSRDEKEADLLAIKRLEANNFSAKGLVTFFERHNKNSNKVKVWVERIASTHPEINARIKYLKKTIKITDGRPIMDDSTWANFKNGCGPHSTVQ